ncbi:hypothetical protein ANO11243_010190 [Dothideomycetidae sp. 11243]|nr:hypothetical protein ANO11243_010190 [fungal sp. No.11243]
MARKNSSHLFTRSFFYSLLVTSTWSSKLVHLASHSASLAPTFIVLYSPTFLLLDCVVLLVGRLLFYRANNWKLRLSTFSAAIGGLLAYVATRPCLDCGNMLLILFCSVITWTTAASQIAFYIETGGEISWSAAGNFVHDRDGIKLLLSGSFRIGLCALAIAVAAFAIQNPLYNGVGHLLHWVRDSFRIRRRGGYQAVSTDVEYSPPPPSFQDKDDGDFDSGLLLPKWNLYVWFSRIYILSIVITVTVLQTLRPTEQPYPHMSDTLPFTLVQAFLKPSTDEYCLPGLVDSMKPFPLPELLAEEYWIPPSDLIPAWHPVPVPSDANISSTGQRPDWLPHSGAIPGFERWTASDSSDLNSYHPELDPLKLTNLDRDILAPIKEALKSSKPNIKHIVMLTLESTRLDVFPLTTHSFLYDTIIDSHPASANLSQVNYLLSHISPNAELLTGTTNSSGFAKFRKNNSNPAKPGSWRARLANKPSGINIVGAVSGSSMTFKSVMNSHCGVQPILVEFTEESELASYQPCIPHILNLFNQNKTTAASPTTKKKEKTKKKKPSATKSFHNAPWKPVFLQSITDTYDRQDMLNTMMGFERRNIFTKENITDVNSTYYPPTEDESGYFGYPESQVKPFLTDLLQEMKNSDERLFLSHFTSQTHHPFKAPDNFPRKEYSKASDDTLNGYLNAVRYDDLWLGQIMDLLDENGMTNETLVVLLGDHGMSFSGDSEKPLSFENPHISNYRVPMVLQHPDLPPMQLEMNATSLHMIPTLLDLLLATDSLPAADAEVARHIMPQYQGQSLLRPLKTAQDGRELWIPSIVTTGGSLLTIGSAASPYRLALPMCKPSEYIFTDISRDPNERQPTSAWSMYALLQKINNDFEYTPEERQKAVEWARDAEKIARWWAWEGKRLWRYSGEE